MASASRRRRSRRPGSTTPSSLLNHPVATTALVVTGLIFLYIEVAAAGIGLAAFPAALCFLLFFWSKFLGGTAGWLEVVLFLAGLVCLLFEIFVIPGFGVVGATGIVLVLLSLVMATQGFLLPRTPTDTRLFVQTLTQWAAGALLFIAAAVAITKRLGGLPVVKELVLAAERARLPWPRSMAATADDDVRRGGDRSASGRQGEIRRSADRRGDRRFLHSRRGAGSGRRSVADARAGHARFLSRNGTVEVVRQTVGASSAASTGATAAFTAETESFGVSGSLSGVSLILQVSSSLAIVFFSKIVRWKLSIRPSRSSRLALGESFRKSVPTALRCRRRDRLPSLRSSRSRRFAR